MDGRSVETYCGPMVRFLLVLAVLSTGGASASAMNWEGHEDWMIDLPAARAFEDAVPAARPSRAPRACQIKTDERSKTRANPYEQIEIGCPHTLGASSGRQKSQ